MLDERYGEGDRTTLRSGELRTGRAPSDRPEPRAPKRDSTPPPKNVLIVDDDADFLDLVLPLLRKRGHTVTVARSGASAKRLAERTDFDVIAVDGVLPDTDGIEWVGELRKNGGEMPIVFMSAFSGMLDSVRRARAQLRVARVVEKPIDSVTFCWQLEHSAEAERPSFPPEAPLPADDALAAARLDYMRSLPGKLQDLADRVRGARNAGDSFLIGEIRTRAHKLRGSAGCYVFHVVGRAAAAIEEAALSMASADGASSDAWDRIDRALAKASALTERIVNDGARRSMPLGVAGARILIVDGDPLLLGAIGDAAEEQLVEVVRATSADAPTVARLAPPDAVIVPVGEDGLDAAVALHARLVEVGGCARASFGFVSPQSSVAQRIALARLGRSLHLAPGMEAEAVALAIRQLLVMSGGVRQSGLVVTRRPEIASRVRRILAESGHGTTVVGDPDDFVGALESARPDVVVLDVESGGLDLGSLMRSDPQWQNVPAIVFSEDDRGEQRMRALRAGADDLVSYDVGDDELTLRIQCRLDRMRLLRERFDKDALTDLPLRRPFLEHLSRSMAECRRHGRPLSLALLDVDLFKKINDVHGHQIADRVLATLGRLLCSRFRAEDLRGRWGGDEFVVAFPGETSEALVGALSSSLRGFGALPFRGKAGAEFRVTFSAGIASYPADGSSTRELLDAADRRLYHAKREGRARVVGSG
jgi:diguanylate cyclase (GGDEF)-like protein